MDLPYIVDNGETTSMPLQEDIQIEIPVEIHNEEVTGDDIVTLRRSKRSITKPQRLLDYQCAMTHTQHISSPHSISSLLSFENLPFAHKVFSTSISINDEPRSYEQAATQECWRQATTKEIEALENNNTWCFTQLPEGKKPIGCKWVFKVKYNADAPLKSTKLGVHYIETFSPVARMTTIRTLLAVVVAKGWFIQQLDVNNAFFAWWPRWRGLHETPSWISSLGAQSSLQI